MASDGIKTAKYLKYAVGKIVLVMIGIFKSKGCYAQ